jgi:alpha-L-rhamnosidase
LALLVDPGTYCINNSVDTRAQQHPVTRDMAANSPFASGQAKWIWVPGYDDTTNKGQFVNFRKVFEVKEKVDREILLHVSADTRYRLYLNGQSISFGPCKSYLSRWNYETVNIAPFLKVGVNVLAARVLRFSIAHDGCLSMIRSPLPGLIVHCQLAVSLSNLA